MRREGANTMHGVGDNAEFPAAHVSTGEMKGGLAGSGYLEQHL